MTAVVSGTRARSARRTGVAGMLMLGGAVAMMVVAAPAQTNPRPHGAAVHPVTQSVLISSSWPAAGPQRSASARSHG